MATEQQTPGRNLIRIDSGVNAVLGLWLIAAPFALAYSATTAAMWNDILLGLAIALLAGIRALGAFEQRSLSWANVVLGAWLVLAPFVLGYTAVTLALWNEVIIGLIVAILAWRSAATATHNA